MTLPMLRGLDDATSNLPGLGMGIASMINPHWQFQQKLQQQMLTNPDLVQQLSEVERNAPGTLLKLGAGPKLSKILATTPMSQERKSEQSIRDYNLKRAELDYQITSSTKDDVIESTKLRRKELEDSMRKIREAAEADKTVKGLDIAKIARDFVNGGKVNPADLQTIMDSKSHPLFQNAVSDARQEKSLLASEARQQRMFTHQQAMLDARQDKTVRDENRRAGISTFQKTKVGTPEAWTEYFSNPENQLRASQLADNPQLVKTKGDRELLAIGNKLKTDNQALSWARTQSATAELRKDRAATKMKGIKPEDVSAIAQQMVPKLDVLRQEGYADLRPVADGKNIYFEDNKTGLKVLGDDIPNTGEIPYNRQEIDAATVEFSKLNIFERKKWLTEKAKDSPKLVDIVKKRFNQASGFGIQYGSPFGN